MKALHQGEFHLSASAVPHSSDGASLEQQVQHIAHSVTEMMRSALGTGAAAGAEKTDPDLRQALKLRLRANHFDTVNAVDGYSATAQAYKEHPDLIIPDLGLPAGDGFVVLDRLQRNSDLANIPVAVLTARDPQSCEQRALMSWATAFFQKPADNTELLEVIRATLAQSVGQQPMPS